jgi:peptide chain release factor 3
VFKVQAQHGPNHRDRVAFVRICSGKLQRGMKVLNSRGGKALALHNPITFFARDRELAHGAVAGDIVGIPNHGTLRVGDTLTERGDVIFTGLPDFAPEILRRVRLGDPLKVKQMRRGLADLAEEGVIRCSSRRWARPGSSGVIGELQLDVLQTRLEGEYGAKLEFEPSPYEVARWVRADDPAELKKLTKRCDRTWRRTRTACPVLLMRNAWEHGRFEQEWPAITFSAVRERN